MACKSISSGIQLDCNGNRGGIKHMWLANYAEGEGNVVFTIDENHTEITAAPTATWYEYAFRPGSSNFTSTLTKDEANGVQFYTTEISLAFARMETQKRTQIAALALAECFAIIEDNNGEYWGFGYDGEGVKLTANTGQTGTAKSDANSYSITLTADSNELPLALSATAVTAFKEQLNG